MSKIKVSTLTGPLLDYWVGKADNKKVRIIPSGSYPYDDRETEIFFHREADGYLYPGTIGLITSDTIPEYSPSTDWSQGGPLLHRKGISVSYYEFYGDGPSKPATLRYWASYYWKPPMKNPIRFNADDPLTAAMQCFVAIHFGEEIDE